MWFINSTWATWKRSVWRLPCFSATTAFLHQLWWNMTIALCLSFNCLKSFDTRLLLFLVNRWHFKHCIVLHCLLLMIGLWLPLNLGQLGSTNALVGHVHLCQHYQYHPDNSFAHLCELWTAHVGNGLHKMHSCLVSLSAHCTMDSIALVWLCTSC